MSFEEKINWIFLGGVTITYFIYLMVIAGRIGAGPITAVSYARPMLSAFAGTLGSIIVIGAYLSTISGPKVQWTKDERDHSISRRGDIFGNFVLAAGGFGALMLTIYKADHFWIGNALYLSFVIVSQVAAVVKIRAYRRGF